MKPTIGKGIGVATAMLLGMTLLPIPLTVAESDGGGFQIVGECAMDSDPDEVAMLDQLVFDPSNLTVPQFAIVRWTNEGDLQHTTTSTEDLWDSGQVGSGGTHSVLFCDTGDYPYQCDNHFAFGMVGIIHVVE